MIRRYLILFSVLSLQPAFSADNPDIRELMTAEEFAASGIGRLSEEEVTAINQWLVRYTAQDAAEVARNSEAVEEVRNAAIRSRIDGQFNGWNGPTRFHLKNGQIWQTNSERVYRYSAVDPEVEITRNWMGIYRMRLLDTDQSIQVRRVQ